ncbi:hypothetical protein ACOMHN_023311 [Nucella lapillus]
MAAVKNMQHLLTSREIQLLMVVAVMTGPLSASSPGPHMKETSFDHLPLNGVLFTEDVCMEVSARSRIECSQKCAETQGCAMWTFHARPQRTPGHCRLHSRLHTAADVKKSEPGAKTRRRRSCAGGYVPACGRCLKAGQRKATYTSARQACTDEQGHLAKATSSALLGCLLSFVKNSGLDWTWLGADDMEEAGVFRWKYGTPLPESSPLWKSGEPGKANSGRDCVDIHPVADNLLLDRPQLTRWQMTGDCWKTNLFVFTDGG